MEINENLSRKQEDYLEFIAEMLYDSKIVRFKDIVEAFDTPKSTVTSILNQLRNRNLISHPHYGNIELTEKGWQVANEVLRRHKILVSYFTRILGMDKKKAEKDACAIEHVISVDALHRLLSFTEFLIDRGNMDIDVVKSFSTYYNKKAKSLNENTEGIYRTNAVSDGIQNTLLSHINFLKENERIKVVKILGDKELRGIIIKKGIREGDEIEISRKTIDGQRLEVKTNYSKCYINMDESASIIIKRMVA